MKKFDKALKAIKDDMYCKMKDAIRDNEHTCYFEYDYGNVTIMIEVECLYGCGVVVPDVWFEREDCEHKSPMVAEAVKNVLPDWWAVVRDYELERRAERDNERFMLANTRLYY